MTGFITVLILGKRFFNIIIIVIITIIIIIIDNLNIINITIMKDWKYHLDCHNHHIIMTIIITLIVWIIMINSY